MHYLVQKILALPTEQKEQVIKQVLNEATALPETKIDKYVVSSMLDYVDEARERLKDFGKMQGISSGYPSLDKLTKGFVGGELTVIAGKTSYGKTTLAMNIANNVALLDHRVLFVTLEMTKAELTSRYMHINGGETDEFLQAAANTIFQENDELNWRDIDGLINNAKKQLNVDLVVIDHLHYFTRELENVAEDLGRITKEIKKNAIQHSLPVILISHVRKTNNKPVTMEDLRGSSYISQDADIVLIIGRDPNNETSFPIKIEKNRNRGFDHATANAILQFDSTKITERSNDIVDINGLFGH